MIFNTTTKLLYYDQQDLSLRAWIYKVLMTTGYERFADWYGGEAGREWCDTIHFYSLDLFCPQLFVTGYKMIQWVLFQGTHTHTMEARHVRRDDDNGGGWRRGWEWNVECTLASLRLHGMPASQKNSPAQGLKLPLCTLYTDTHLTHYLPLLSLGSLLHKSFSNGPAKLYVVCSRLIIFLPISPARFFQNALLCIKCYSANNWAVCVPFELVKKTRIVQKGLFSNIHTQQTV